MKIITLFFSFTALLLADGFCYAQESRLTEMYLKALSPPEHSTTNDQSSSQSRGVAKNRGVDMVAYDAEGTVNQEPSVTLNVEFDFNSSEITPQKNLDALGKALQHNKLNGFVFKIEGHTDSIGGDAYNLELSIKRALAVADYMGNFFGLERDQFKIQGFGKSQPIASNDSEEGRSKNRRVVIKNTRKAYVLSPSKKPEINVKVITKKDNLIKELHEGTTLSQSDRYAIELEPKSSAFVYVYQIDAKGKVDTLFPNSELSQNKNAVKPQKIRIPEWENSWIPLDNNKGKEKILVIAQREELRHALDICMRVNSFDDTIANSTDNRMKSEGPDLRGLGKVIIEEPGKLDFPVAKTQTQDVDMEKIFIWKMSFIHQ